MKICNINNNIKNYNHSRAEVKSTTFKGKTGFADIGEGASIACDFFGKAAIVPIVIMLTSKEPKDKKEYSALKNPVAATIQLLLEVPILQVGSKIVSKLANNGYFDVKNSDFSYNELAKKNEFTNILKNTPINSSEVKQKAQNILKTLEEKGYDKNLKKDFSALVEMLDETSAATLKSSFETLEKTHKNQFHLANRICFLVSILLTPLLCALENKIHPIIMNKIFEKQHKTAPSMKFDTMDDFLRKTKCENINEH